MLSQIPDGWKFSIVSPVFKGGAKDRAERSLSFYFTHFLRCPGLGELINKQLLSFLLGNKLIYQHQSGFLPKHSTVSQLALLVHQLHIALEQRKTVRAAFLDLRGLRSGLSPWLDVQAIKYWFCRSVAAMVLVVLATEDPMRQH